MRVGEFTVHFRTSKERLPLSHKEVPSIMCAVHLGVCAHESAPCNTQNTAYAFAQTSPKDLHRPLVGRKIALSRALKALNLTKEQRKAFWDAYYTKTPKPKSGHKRG